MTDGFVLAHDLAESMVALTSVKWAQKPGVKSESLDRAWKRLFGSAPGMPVMFTYCKWQGRDVVVRLYPRGRLAVIDPINGASIRTVNWRAVDAAANIAARLRAFDPMTAYFQSHGRPVGSRSESSHNGRLAGATDNFLLKTG